MPDAITTTAIAAITTHATSLGIELGSTRIKAVLIGPDRQPLATGGHAWENRFVDGVWTYDLADVWDGVRACYADLAVDVLRRHGLPLTGFGAIGVSAMMHGYLAFDAAGELLTPFRTWRNTSTGRASDELTELFGQHIPQRWSVAHLHQALLDAEPHVGSVAHLTTLAGHVHDRLTGERVLGVGDASGMFPIDPATGGFDARLLARYDALVAGRAPWRLADLLPTVLPAGGAAGVLSEAGARLLDPAGTLAAGAVAAPPEGDAGTGMIATNAVAPRTGNVSAGTSIFAMAVLERPLAGLHREIDLVTTPAGDPVAMVHCNNGTSDLNAWLGLFDEFAGLLGVRHTGGELYELLYRHALGGDADGGGLLAYNYVSGEHITEVAAGRPLFVRTPTSRFTLANFVRTHLFASLGALRVGLDILLREEGVQLDRLFGHGGFFKTEGVGERLLAAALDTPVSVGEVAGEGGAWGMALLAAYAAEGDPRPLATWLAEEVFAGAAYRTAEPDAADVAGFEAFMDRYRAGLALERAAGTALA